MPPLNDLLLFTGAAFIMNLSPGPANFYVMARTLAQGTYAGFAATAGLALGSLLHVVAAVLGLSVLFSYSPVAYTLLKIVGASYLIYLGLGYFRILFPREKNPEELESGETTPEILVELDTRKIFFQSVIIEASNPKTALFSWHYYPSLL
jgi:threonine/homoserine/homoserine lactone efflux protein